MGKYAYLLKVEPQANNNKFYEMSENPDGTTFTSNFGRVDSTPQSKVYQMYEWDKVYNAKLSDRKGYTDITKYRAVIEQVAQDDTITHKSKLISEIFNHFQTAAKGMVAKNYNVTAVGVVTQTMLDEAQNILNLLSENIQCGDYPKFNKHLTTLFHVIPRKMEKVSLYILDLDQNDTERAKELLTNEQSLLDTLSGQVYISNSDINENATTDMFDVLGLSVDECTAKEIETIKLKMGSDVRRFVSAIKVTHLHGRQLYEAAACQYEPGNVRLEWHGSRTENWLSILRTGLVLHPTAAQISGKMFGYGLYFAPKAAKSIGYTSTRYSHWANGSDNFGYLGLFDLNLGRTMTVQRHKSEYERFTQSKIKSLGYDSLHALGGYDLINDEIIIYSENQCSVSYIVRIQ